MRTHPPTTLDPAEDPRVDLLLRRMAEELPAAPDEVTSARHRRLIRHAATTTLAPRVGRRVAVATGIAAAVALGAVVAAPEAFVTLEGDRAGNETTVPSTDPDVRELPRQYHAPRRVPEPVTPRSAPEVTPAPDVRDSGPTAPPRSTPEPSAPPTEAGTPPATPAPPAPRPTEPPGLVDPPGPDRAPTPPNRPIDPPGLDQLPPPATSTPRGGTAPGRTPPSDAGPSSRGGQGADRSGANRADAGRSDAGRGNDAGRSDAGRGNADAARGRG